tara:strand:+ start:8303 stop:8683 length:381 start_codon:yes stop_codon:yes gene_type:complete
MILRSWREAEVHQVGDGRLPFAVVERTHGELLQLATKSSARRGRALTDSTIASSSVCLKRFEPLCCFLACWLLRGVGEERLDAPVPTLPRCCPKKWTVLSEPGWFCAGEAGPEDVGAFDDDATGGS